MPQIQLQQLRPGATSTSRFSVDNTTATAANAAIELVKLIETKQLLATYIEITIRELTDEPRIVFGPHALSKLHHDGFTVLSVLAPNQSKTYEAKFIVSDEIPDTFQKQRLTFDLNLGTQTIAVDPSPSPVPQAFVIQSPPHAPTPAVLGVSTSEATTIDSPPTLPPTVIIVSVLVALLATILLLLAHRLRRNIAPTSS